MSRIDKKLNVKVMSLHSITHNTMETQKAAEALLSFCLGYYMNVTVVISFWILAARE